VQLSERFVALSLHSLLDSQFQDLGGFLWPAFALYFFIAAALIIRKAIPIGIPARAKASFPRLTHIRMQR
jgi:hypothetical protein